MSTDPADSPAPEPTGPSTGAGAGGENGSGPKGEEHSSPPAAGQQADGTHGDADGRSGAKGDAGDALDPEALRAYEAGRHVLNPGTTLISGQAAYVTVQNFVGTAVGRAALPSPGPVPDEQLRALRKRYVAVPGYDHLEDALHTGRLVVLVGPPDSGRSTTALHVLDSITNRKVFRLEPGRDLSTLPAEQIEHGHGYLGTAAAGEVAGMQALADRLIALVRHREVFCVLTAPDDPVIHSAFGTAVRRCPLPEAHELLSQHIEAGVRPGDRSGTVRRSMDVVHQEQLQVVWKSDWRPADVAGLAELLLAHDRKPDIEKVRAYPAGLLEGRIAEWMSALRGTHGERAERARRVTAFRIACAVFDGMPRHVVERAADDLALCMVLPPVRSQDRGRPVMQTPRVTTRVLAVEDDGLLLDATGLDLDQREVPYLGSTVPAELLRFRDDRVPVALLRHVWVRHPPLRGPVVAWLDGLSRDTRPAVRTRAAQAAGLLCSVDFGGTVEALVTPAARATPRRRRRNSGENDGVGVEDANLDEPEEPWELRRQFAAIALDHAARDVRVREAVEGLLKRWRRNDEPALRWTAARARGYDIGHRQLPVSFEELRVIGTPQERTDLGELSGTDFDQEWGLVWASGLSLALLFANGSHRPVLSQLREWMWHPRMSLRKLAVQAVIIIADLKVSSVGRPEDAGPDIGTEEMLFLGDPSRSRWPVLLALESTGSALVHPSAELLRAALRSSWGGRVTARVVVGWFNQAGSDEAVLAAVEAFLPRLLVETSDQAMLRSLVNRKRRAWEDPLKPEVADRLEAVITGASVVRRRG